MQANIFSMLGIDVPEFGSRVKEQGETINGTKEGERVELGTYLGIKYKSKGSYINGIKTGLRKITYESGLAEEGNYCNDLREGERIFITQTGRKITGNYVNGKKEGLWTTLYKNGQIIYSEFKDDKPINGTINKKNPVDGNWI